MTEEADPLGRIVALLRFADPDVDALGIAESVWLAALRLAEQPESQPVVAHDRAAVSGRPIGAAFIDQPPGGEPPVVEGPGTQGLFQPMAVSDGPVTRGQAVRVPRGRALPRFLDLGRSMKPLKRRWPAGRRQELDLAATVDAYARSLELLPVFRSAPERWFELVMIVDRSASMAVWRHVIAEFTEVLRKTGAFRKLHVWDMYAEKGEVVVRGPRGQALVPEQLSAPGGRRLAVVISDCLPEGWRSGNAWLLLREWSRNVATALINPLPLKLWRPTGLDLPAVVVGPSGAPGRPNTALPHDVPLALPADWAWVPVPALTLTPYSLRRWTRTIMSVDSLGCDAVLIPDPAALIGRPQDLRQDEVSGVAAPDGDGRRDDERVVSSFLHLASPRAVELAVFCTRFPAFDLALLDIIRAGLVPTAEVADAAEVVASGLFAVESDKEADAVLRFRPGMRERLGAMLSAYDAGRLTDMLSDHFAVRLPAVLTFEALVRDPQGDRMLPSDAEPFAQVTEETLRRMGTDPQSALTKPGSAPTSAGELARRPAAVAAVQAARQQHLPAVQDLRATLADLGTAAADLNRIRAELLTDETDGGTRERLTSWARPLREVADLVAREQAECDRLLARLRRPSLNVTVTGRPGHGKSRFLQSLTGLSAQVIPDGRGGPCTGVPTMIRHVPGDRTYADVFFHSPASFLAEVISPGYRRLGLGTPASLRDFGSMPLPRPPAGDDGAVAAYEHLAACHRAFGDYQALIGATSPQQVAADQIRGFAAKHDATGRPQHAYLAVRAVRVNATFPHPHFYGVTFFDLPGLGGGDPADARARAVLGYDSDLTLMVRRPDPRGDAVQAADVAVYRFAENALPQVPMERRSFLILNTDPGHLTGAERLRDQAASSAIRTAGIRIADCSAAEPARDALSWILDHPGTDVGGLDELLVAEERRRVGEIQQQASRLANEMSVLRAGGEWAQGLSALLPSGVEEDHVSSGGVPPTSGPADQVIVGNHDRRPRLPRSGEAKIVLWGAPASGKTTYLAALPQALTSTGGSVGRWAIYPNSEISEELLINWSHQLISMRAFPEATPPGRPTDLAWSFRGDLTGTKYARRRRWWQPQSPSVTCAFDLSLIDVSGEVFGYDPARSDVSPAVVNETLDHMTRADGLIYLFDPVTERDEGNADAYMNRTLIRLSRRVMEEGRLIGPYLPHYIAVCITKLDDRDVFRQAAAAGLVNYGPDRIPRVLDEHAEQLFDTMCSGRFWPEERTDNRAGAQFVRKQLRQYFHPDRIRYYAISSVGYKKPSGEDPQAALRPGFRFDPNDFANVVERGGRQQILGPVEPVNVLEPLVDLQMRISGQA